MPVELETISLSNSDTDIAISVTGLVKKYRDLVAVDGIDFEVRRGTCLGILGPNGAGKTTTIEMLEGLEPPDAGKIRVLGRSWNDDPRAIQERIGVQLQETEFQDKITAFELLRMLHSLYQDGADIDNVIAMIGLGEKRDARIKTLSGGQKQRLALGCALIGRPEILFLDEPTTGLDPQSRRRLWEVIRDFMSSGGTVLITTHYMDEAERLADDLIIIDRGSVIARGSPEEIIASLGADAVVQFSLGTAHSGDLDDQDLTGLAGVRSVRREAAEFVLSVVEPQTAIPALLQLIDNRGLRLEDLRTHRPTLEDVFVSLTGKYLRDG